MRQGRGEVRSREGVSQEQDESGMRYDRERMMQGRGDAGKRSGREEV